MKKQNATGVFQLDSGSWGYRITFTEDGKRMSKRSVKNELGNPIKTKREAIKERKLAIERGHIPPKPKTSDRKTMKQVFDEFCENGRKDRAYQTIRKQDSLWDNHLSERFGKCYVDEICSAEVIDYLTELYHVEGYSHQYTNSFLKMFYLIFGQAYSRNYLDVDRYNKLCVIRILKSVCQN